MILLLMVLEEVQAKPMVMEAAVAVVGTTLVVLQMDKLVALLEMVWLVWRDLPYRLTLQQICTSVEVAVVVDLGRVQVDRMAGCVVAQEVLVVA